MEQHHHLKNDTKRQLNKCVEDLYTYCENGNFSLLEQITEKEDFSGQSLNLAFRKTINKINEFSPKNPNFQNFKKCIRLLLTLNIDLNYQDDKDSKFKNSTILHLLCMKGDLNLIRFILEQKIEKSKPLYHNNNNHNIDFSIVDSNKRNVFHYLIQHYYTNEKQETFIIEIFNYFFNKYITNINTSVQKVFLDLLNEPDVDGNIALTLALMNGWKKLTMLILKVSNCNQIVNRNGNNCIHCAIEGNNIKCLKIILYYAELDDLKENKKMITPLTMAYRKGNYAMGKLIEHFEKNFHRKGYKEEFLALKIDNEMYKYILMEMFHTGKYEKTVYGIEMYKILENVKCCVNNKDNIVNNNIDIINNNITYNVSLEWNLLLTTYKYLCNRNITNTNSNNSNNNTNKKNKNVTHIYPSFFYNNINIHQYQHLLFPLQDEMKLFFQNHFPIYHIINPSQTSPPFCPIDLMIYNKIIFHLHNNDIHTLIDTIITYITNTFHHNKTSYFKWISYVNISLILIEILINFNYTSLSLFIIESLEKFLFTSNDSYNKDLIYSIRNESIFKNENIMNYIMNYLNGIVIFTQFSKTWYETFCYINLLKIIINKDNYTKCKNDYDILKERNKNIKMLYIFNKIEMLYECIEMKIYYHLNYVYGEYYENDDNDEKIIYYYNSLGIMNMKLKKFSFAEMHFRNALNVYKNIIHNTHKHKILFDMKIQYIYYIKFNLALCLFYKKEYTKAKNIFLMLSKSKFLSKNFYVWYRLGLCYLEMELHKQRTKVKGYNDILKHININEHKTHNTNHEHEHINKKYSDSSIEYEDIDDLYIQFERECGNGKVNKMKNCSYMKQQYKHKQSLHNDEDNEMNVNLNEYDIKSYNKFFIYDYKYNSNSLINETNHFHSKHKKTISYIHESIFALKQSLLITNMNFFNKDSLHSIYEFYMKTNNNNTNQNNSLYYNSSFSYNKENHSIIINAYISLLFSLSLNEEWLQILFYINELKSHHYHISNEINIQIDSYRIEALIHLNQYAQAEEIIKSNLELYQTSNCKCDYYCKMNSYNYNVHFKMNLHYNLCLIHLKNNNIKEAEECIKLICDNYIEDKMHIPGCLVHVIIYINLIKYNNYTQKEELLEEDKIKKYKYIKNAISLIKTRRQMNAHYYNGQ